jgi:hypothetical protein
MLSLLQFWATWKVRIMAGLAIALAAMALSLRLISVGRQQQIAADAKRRLEAVKKRGEVDDAVSQLSDADLDSRYDKWLRDRERR